MQTIRLTVREAAQAIQRQFGGPLCPDWALRRIVDELDADGHIDLHRVGLYRAVASDDLSLIANELRRLGRLETEVTP